jgi:hypothetical protein
MISVKLDWERHMMTSSYDETHRQRPDSEGGADAEAVVTINKININKDRETECRPCSA